MPTRQAGWWCGNGSLPRVAQWRDALIALYNLPEDDLLGFTHAFFPAYAFDEHVIEHGWAFARQGDGYLALHAAHGMTLVTTGNDAQRELRSVGQRNAWVCQMGRAEVDGSFEEFRSGSRSTVWSAAVNVGSDTTIPTNRSLRVIVICFLHNSSESPTPTARCSCEMQGR